MWKVLLSTIKLPTRTHSAVHCETGCSLRCQSAVKNNRGAHFGSRKPQCVYFCVPSLLGNNRRASFCRHKQLCLCSMFTYSYIAAYRYGCLLYTRQNAIAFRRILSSGMQHCVTAQFRRHILLPFLGPKSKPKRLASKLLLKFLRNIVELLSDCMPSRPRRQDFSQLPLSEPQIERGHFQCT